MKLKLIIGGLLLTFGSALAGNFFFSGVASQVEAAESSTAVEEVPSPELIATWKATAMTTDYLPPRVPI
jgi:hypothetical protein